MGLRADLAKLMALSPSEEREVVRLLKESELDAVHRRVVYAQWCRRQRVPMSFETLDTEFPLEGK